MACRVCFCVSKAAAPAVTHPTEEAVRTELSELKLSELKHRAEASGANVDAAEDQDGEAQKQAYTDLIVAQEQAAQEHAAAEAAAPLAPADSAAPAAETETAEPEPAAADEPEPEVERWAEGEAVKFAIIAGSISGENVVRMKLDAVTSVEQVHAELLQKFGLGADVKLQIRYLEPEFESYVLLDDINQLPKIAKLDIHPAHPTPREVLSAVAEEDEAAKQLEQTNAVARAQMEHGKADKEMAAGTRIEVFGYGEGSYVSFKKKTGKSNEHTIDFGIEAGSPGMQIVKLKNKDWKFSVADGVIKCDIA